MVVFELGNFVYNTSDDEITIFLTFLRQMLALSYSPSSNDDWSPCCIKKKPLSYAAVII